MLDDLPLEDDRRMTGMTNGASSYASVRCLVAECFEQHGMLEAAIKWARAELADRFVINSPSRIRAGRLIGRAHAALGQHELSIAAFDAAAELARVGRYLESELLTAQSRAVAGRAAGCGRRRRGRALERGDRAGAGVGGGWAAAAVGERCGAGGARSRCVRVEPALRRVSY